MTNIIDTYAAFSNLDRVSTSNSYQPRNGYDLLQFYKDTIIYNYTYYNIWYPLYTKYYPSKEALFADIYHTQLLLLISDPDFLWPMLSFTTEQKKRYDELLQNCSLKELVYIYENGLVEEKDWIYNRIIENKDKTLDAIDMVFKNQDDFNKYIDNSLSPNTVCDILESHCDLTEQHIEKIFNIMEEYPKVRLDAFYNYLVLIEFKELMFKRFCLTPDVILYERIFSHIICYTYPTGIRSTCFNYLIQHCAFSFWQQYLEDLNDEELKQVYDKFKKLEMIPTDKNRFYYNCRIFNKFINDEIKWRLVDILIRFDPYLIGEFINDIDFNEEQLTKLRSIQCLNELN